MQWLCPKVKNVKEGRLYSVCLPLQSPLYSLGSLLHHRNFIIQKLLKNDSTFALNYQNYMLNSLVKLTSKYLHKYKHIYSEELRKA